VALCLGDIGGRLEMDLVPVSGRDEKFPSGPMPGLPAGGLDSTVAIGDGSFPQWILDDPERAVQPLHS